MSTKSTITTITNEFTGYRRTLKTNGLPKIDTLKRHLRQSKAAGWCSVTRILTNVDDTGAGDDVEITRFGELLINGRPA